jgi:hypothetical protein
MKTYIYILIDPITNCIRYVGKANNPKQRYRAHKNKCRDKNTYKRNWINSLQRKQLQPEIEILEEVLVSEWKYWEKFYIEYFTFLGFSLTNCLEGGEGLTFGNKTSFKKGNKAKAVLAIDANNKIIYEFKSSVEASTYFNLHRSTINGCINNNYKTCQNLVWYLKERYTNMNKIEIEKDLKHRFTNLKTVTKTQFKKGVSIRNVPIKVTNLNTNEIKHFASGVEAAKFLNMSQSSIPTAIKKSYLLNKKQYKVEYAK